MLRDVKANGPEEGTSLDNMGSRRSARLYFTYLISPDQLSKLLLTPTAWSHPPDPPIVNGALRYSEYLCQFSCHKTRIHPCLPPLLPKIRVAMGQWGRWKVNGDAGKKVTKPYSIFGIVLPPTCLKTGLTFGSFRN